MHVTVADYSEFLSSVYNYIIEYHEIVPRDFEGVFVPGIKIDYGIVVDSSSSSSLYKRNDCKTKEQEKEEELSSSSMFLRQQQQSDGHLFLDSDTDGAGTALRYTVAGRLEPFVCPFYKKSLHVHDDDSIFCSEPELLAVRYIFRSIFSPKKRRIIETLKHWLPTVTVDSVNVRFDRKDFDRDTDVVRSDLSPAYCLHFLHQNHSAFDTLTYYFISNIVLEEKGDCYEYEYELIQQKSEYDDDVYNKRKKSSLLLFSEKELQRQRSLINKKRIMVRRRSRSRSSSRSRSGGGGGSGGRRRRRSGRRRKSRSPSRSRSRSPSSSGRGYRRRSRSRSRSRG